MSRVGKHPVLVPEAVKVSFADSVVSVDGPRGSLSMNLFKGVSLKQEGQEVSVVLEQGVSSEQQGVARVLLANMVQGVSQGFERKLVLIGVGYRAQAQNSGKELNLAVGFSHPLVIPMPEGITVETPIPTEILIKGADKQKVGQISAEIRAHRPPEPYKGKGVRYADERVVMKETKKK